MYLFDSDVENWLKLMNKLWSCKVRIANTKRTNEKEEIPNINAYFYGNQDISDVLL